MFVLQRDTETKEAAGTSACSHDKNDVITPQWPSGKYTAGPGHVPPTHKHYLDVLPSFLESFCVSQ